MFTVENSVIYKQLKETEAYAAKNLMNINFSKTRLMLFNPCSSVNFFPHLCIADKDLELVSEKKFLDVTVRSDLKWTSNTENIVKSASKRLWMLRRLKILGASKDALLQVYMKQIRSLLEYSVPVW